jgi:rhamnosyltransferase
LKITVIIPVKNGDSTLEKCLVSIRSQTIGNLEIIVLDSMSTDNSREIANKYHAKIIPVADGTFNHGLTRNIGAQKASGDLLFFTVQDAWLSENNMLEKMAKHFDDEKVMGTVGHQAVPHEKDKNPMLWYKRYSEPEITVREVKDIQKFNEAGQASRQALISWDDVVAMYRKSALIQQPFVETQFAEDWIWSRDALLRGWKLIYDPSLVVYHYHHSGYHYAYKVAFALNYHFYKFFNFKPAISDVFLPIARATYHLIKNPQLTIKEKWYWIFHNYIIRIGTFNSHVNFLFHNFIGGIKSVEKRYNKVCKKIPQGEQKK